MRTAESSCSCNLSLFSIRLAFAGLTVALDSSFLLLGLSKCEITRVGLNFFRIVFFKGLKGLILVKTILSWFSYGKRMGKRKWGAWSLGYGYLFFSRHGVVLGALVNHLVSCILRFSSNLLLFAQSDDLPGKHHNLTIQSEYSLKGIYSSCWNERTTNIFPWRLYHKDYVYKNEIHFSRKGERFHLIFPRAPAYDPCDFEFSNSYNTHIYRHIYRK